MSFTLNQDGRIVINGKDIGSSLDLMDTKGITRIKVDDAGVWINGEHIHPDKGDDMYKTSTTKPTKSAYKFVIHGSVIGDVGGVDKSGTSMSCSTVTQSTSSGSSMSVTGNTGGSTNAGSSVKVDCHI